MGDCGPCSGWCWERLEVSEGPTGDVTKDEQEFGGTQPPPLPFIWISTAARRVNHRFKLPKGGWHCGIAFLDPIERCALGIEVVPPDRERKLLAVS